jgi:predicted Zn-dependent peptidase
MVTRHFGTIARGAPTPALRSMVLPPTFGGWLRDTVEDAVVAPRLFLAFRIPAFGHDEWYAASLLAAVLGNREGSRLARALMREQAIASSATAFTFDLPKGADLLVCDVMARPGVLAERLEAAVVAEIERVSLDGVSQAELDRALAVFETEWVAGLQSAASRADKLSQFATYFGDAARVNDELDRYRALGPADVADGARAWLHEQNRASLLYLPDEKARMREGSA